MPTNWVTFVTGPAAIDAGFGPLTQYHVTECRAIAGPMPHVVPGSRMTRLESTAPVPLTSGIQLRGTVQHQNYTASTQRASLDSIPPFGEQAGIHCVLIPIHKNEAWWQMPADIRASHFHQAGAHHQHAAVGAPYVHRIHRRLYHARYSGGAEAPIPYDFLTYFEFPDADRPAFEDLLAGLRDTQRNPEWAYVDGEYEIWMRRVEPL
jgi:hypothetical protein